jgi:multiple sugar transport system permease protein
MEIKMTTKKISSYFMLLICAIVFTFPVYWIFTKAFNGPEGILAYPPEVIPKTFSLDNFKYAEETYHISRMLLNTVVVSCLSVIAATCSSVFVAYGFARLSFKGKSLLFSIVLASMMLPWDITIIPQFIEFTKLNMTNSYYPLILPLCFGVPFYIFLLRQFIMGLPYALDEAALIDGCNRFDILTRILLPLLKPAITMVAVYQFLASWNDFLNPLVYLNSNKQFTISMGIYYMNSSISGVDWPAIMAGAAVAVVIPIIVFAVSQRYLIEGVAMSGLKD